MKFFALAATIALVSAAAEKAGTACEKAIDECGDKTTMCCGVAQNGKMCTEATCKTTVDDIPVPNFVVCNVKASPESFVIT